MPPPPCNGLASLNVWTTNYLCKGQPYGALHTNVLSQLQDATKKLLVCIFARQTKNAIKVVAPLRRLGHWPQADWPAKASIAWQQVEGKVIIWQCVNQVGGLSFLTFNSPRSFIAISFGHPQTHSTAGNPPKSNVNCAVCSADHCALLLWKLELFRQPTIADNSHTRVLVINYWQFYQQSKNID